MKEPMKGIAKQNVEYYNQFKRKLGIENHKNYADNDMRIFLYLRTLIAPAKLFIL